MLLWVFFVTVGLPSGGILSLPKMFLDPRRPEIVSEQSRWVLSFSVRFYWNLSVTFISLSVFLTCALDFQWREPYTLRTRVADPYRVVHQLQSDCVKSARNIHCPLWTGVDLPGESLANISCDKDRQLFFLSHCHGGKFRVVSYTLIKKIRMSLIVGMCRKKKNLTLIWSCSQSM